MKFISTLLLATAPFGGHAFTTPVASAAAAVTCKHRLFFDSFSVHKRKCGAPKPQSTLVWMSSKSPSEEELEEPSEDPLEKAVDTSISSETTAPSFASVSSTIEDVGSSVKSATTDVFSNIDAANIKANVLEGDVGERGEAWTAAWFLLAGCILFGGLPIPFLDSLFSVIGGPGLIVGGGAIILASLKDLGSTNLTPFLSPVSGGTLVTTGIFSQIRHPTYAGLICLCAGFSILTGSAPRLVVTALLIFVLDIKSDKEEEMLSENYGDYAAYKAAVTGKFIPGDWTFRRDEN